MLNGPSDHTRCDPSLGGLSHIQYFWGSTQSLHIVYEPSTQIVCYTLIIGLGLGWTETEHAT